jgi:hypothetical protein
LGSGKAFGNQYQYVDVIVLFHRSLALGRSNEGQRWMRQGVADAVQAMRLPALWQA